MKTFINHETYGQIVCEENFWTGKKNLIINGKYLTKIDKKTFCYNDGKEDKYFTLNGSFIRGLYISVGIDKIQITPPIKWYELILPIFLFAVLLVWGSSVRLCSILPIVGGAVGGLINALGMILSMLAMKSMNSVWLKLLVWLGISALTVLINFTVAIFIIAAMV